MLGRKKKANTVSGKYIDLDAGMQGKVIFKDPVNLRINGNFEGDLEARGKMIIGETANIRANITGDSVEIKGAVAGNIKAVIEIKIFAGASVTGNIESPSIAIEKGAIFNGSAIMEYAGRAANDIMDSSEVAQYLEMDEYEIINWAKSGKIPALNEDGAWKFNKREVDEWVSSEKV